MAKIKPMALIESMSKKVCEHSDVYFRTNKKTGAVYTGKLCNPSTKEPSVNQTAAKARFAKVSAAVRSSKTSISYFFFAKRNSIKSFIVHPFIEIFIFNIHFITYLRGIHII